MWLENTCKDLEPWIDALEERVPAFGKCESHRGKNKSLDRFRRAQNVIHDIFNNGLMNRARELRVLDKNLRVRDLPIWASNEDKWDIIENRISPLFRVIVENAVFEQFGREEFLRMMHNRSSHIIKKAIDEGRVVSNV
mgnify:CR=1 FL=1|tara:strand:- start:375 stop:788 length:414 start_codon:yes stop_codon:yes gene_type:complete